MLHTSSVPELSGSPHWHTDHKSQSVPSWGGGLQLGSVSCPRPGPRSRARRARLVSGALLSDGLCSLEQAGLRPTCGGYWAIHDQGTLASKPAVPSSLQCSARASRARGRVFPCVPTSQLLARAAAPRSSQDPSPPTPPPTSSCCGRSLYLNV